MITQDEADTLTVGSYVLLDPEKVAAKLVDQFYIEESNSVYLSCRFGVVSWIQDPNGGIEVRLRCVDDTRYSHTQFIMLAPEDIERIEDGRNHNI